MTEPGDTERRAAPRTWLFVLPWSLDAVGGVNQVVLNLASEMKRSGAYRPLVLITDWDAQRATAPETRSDGVQTLRWQVRSPPSGGGLKERLAYALWLVRFSREFKAFCQARNVAVINPHYPGGSGLSLQRIATRFQQPPRVLFSFHGTDMAALESSATERVRWQQALRQADTRAVVCSQAAAQRFKDAVGDVPAVVYNGVDGAALMQSAGLPAERTRRTILSVGKFEAQKGQSTLVEAFALIHARFPDVDLLLVGATDSQLPVLQALARQRGIEDRVGFVTDVPHARMGRYFANADLFAFPSLREQFGLVLLEAATFGLPVAASRVGGIPEIIRDGDTGRLVAPDHADELAAALSELLADRPAAAAMGARLRAEVQQRFSWQKTAAAYAALATQST